MREVTISPDEYWAGLMERGSTEGRTMPTEPVVWYDFTEEIDRGVALLNKYDAGWASKIDLVWLNLSSGTSCVLGQLAMKSFANMINRTMLASSTGFHAVVHALSLRGETDPHGIEHGFCLPPLRDDNGDEDNARVEWEHLTWQWADRVEKELANA